MVAASASFDPLALPVKVATSSWHLFTPARFRVHRLVGMLYILQFVALAVFEVRGTPDWKLHCTLPLTGLIQAIVANCTFTFLPKANEKTQGYYDDTKVMSYAFIRESLYFHILLFFQAWYLAFNQWIRQNVWLLPLEVVMVFFPYYTFRGFFPKSSFRHSIKEGNRFAMVTKCFFMFGKHYNGYYLNYLGFIGHFGAVPLLDWAILRRMLLLGGWGTTIAVFLQTLKFKRYISPTVMMLLYTGVFPLLMSVYVGIIFAAREQAILAVLTFMGLLINFRSRTAQISFQAVLAAWLVADRFGVRLNLLD